jgi:hypothetical protein
MTAEDTSPTGPDPAAIREKAPRRSEDEPWLHPADGGESLGGGDFWRHDIAFGVFQQSEEIPDDVANALRTVYETMQRAGFRDWELEWDYVECAYWSLRRHLEVNAREAFRLWYGDDSWQEPFQAACRLQQASAVEYRIDHLLTTELGVAIRKRPTPKAAPPATGRKAPTGSKRDAVLAHYAAALADGPLTARQLAERISAEGDQHVSSADVYNTLRKSASVRVTEGMSQSGQKALLFSLPDRTRPGA